MFHKDIKDNRIIWPWDQGPKDAAVTTRQIADQGYPVLRVIHHDDDHGWTFLCGTTQKTSDMKVVDMIQAVGPDPTLNAIADLEPGYTAYRKAFGAPWIREKYIHADNQNSKSKTSDKKPELELEED